MILNICFFRRLVFLCIVFAGPVNAQILGFGKSSSEKVKEMQLDKPFVTVNGEVQSTARAEVLLRDQYAIGVADTEELRTAVRNTLVMQAAVAQEARKMGLDKDPMFKARLELSHQSLLAQAWQQKFLAENPPQDSQIRAEYDRQVAALGDTDYRIRHILVSDEETAKIVIGKLKSGRKFSDLAFEYSQDVQTKGQGGLADWTNVAVLMPALANSLKLLKNGQFASMPVRSDLGWHVLQLEESRPFLVVSYEQAKPKIQAAVAGALIKMRVSELINKAQIQ